MKSLITACLVLAAVVAGGWATSADAHWRGRGIQIRIGAPVVRASYHSYGWGVAPGYVGGYYAPAPVYPVTYYGGYPAHGYYGGGYSVSYYGGCGW